MNCLQPNLPENFDLVATFEAFDTYSNLKTAVFDHYSHELHWLYKLDEGLEPSLMVLFKQSGEIKAPIMVEVFSGGIASPFQHDIVVVDEELLEMKPNFFQGNRRHPC
jgi:hypothetical protein